MKAHLGKRIASAGMGEGRHPRDEAQPALVVQRMFKGRAPSEVELHMKIADSR
jgi:hypothetical protein